MNRLKLYNKLDVALAWNGILFVLRKISKTVLSFILLYKLTTADFSLWANTYSIIYITLLWLNFGFSRSLPQYCLSFAKNTKLKNRFIAGVIIFKVAISILAALALYLLTPYLTGILNLPSSSMFYSLACILFIAEGTKSVLRLIFYSYFWQKKFNFIEGIIITAHTIFIILMASKSGISNNILKYVFMADISGAIILIVCSCFMLRGLSRDKDYQGNARLNTRRLVKDFSIHSGVMWSLISMNSLTERNFLVPFFTYLLGPYFANIFKVANDAALLFQRFVIKTIGTTGTSLFAHIETGQLKTVAKQRKYETSKAFSRLNKRIILLVSPLFGLITLLFLQLSYSTELFKIFFLLVLLYLMQIIFMAYERLLEVKRNYKELFISFIPYILIAILFITSTAAPPYLLTLPIILLVIHTLRTMSLAIRVFYTKRLYGVTFPVKWTLASISLIVAISCLVHLAFGHFGINFTEYFISFRSP